MKYRNIPRVHFHIHDYTVTFVDHVGNRNGTMTSWAVSLIVRLRKPLSRRLALQSRQSGYLSSSRSHLLVSRFVSSFSPIFSARLLGCVLHSSSALSASIRVIAEKLRDPTRESRDCISIPARRAMQCRHRCRAAAIRAASIRVCDEPRHTKHAYTQRH